MLKRIFALSLLIVMLWSPSTYALTADQRRVFDAHIHFFNTENTACAVSVSTNLNGNDNIEKIFNYLTGKGLSVVQAAGMMGNMQLESSFIPTKVEGGTWGGKKWGGESDTVPPAVGPHGEPGYGIVQWTSPGRKAGLVTFAGNAGKPVSDLGVQLDYLWSELNGSYKAAVLDPIKASSDLATVTAIWQHKYEVGGGDAIRQQYARDIYAKLSGMAPSTGTTASADTSGSSCDTVSEPGQPTKFVEGFPIYSQYDPAWKDKPYSSSTIGESGCGPSAMAMIITALTGKTVTPVDTAAYAAAQNQYEAGSGSRWTIAPVLAEHWGLKANLIGADVAKITATLQAGGLVAAPGHGADPYTSHGHYIVIRGVTASGKFKVGDSGHSDTSDKEWDAAQLVSQMHGGGVYAITK
jgi:hypothetical protein